MPLWDRFTRMVKSNVGRLLDDPLEKSGAGKKLEQRMKELRARDGELKALDEQLITLKGHATFLERKLEKLKLKEAEQEARLKAASAHGSISAIGAEGDLKIARADAAQVEAELTGTRSAVERAEAQKRALVEEKAARLAAAQEALLEVENGPAPSSPSSSSTAHRATPPAPEPLSHDPTAPLHAEPEPKASEPALAPRIKITPKGGDDSPRKTIGPQEDGRPRPAEAAPSSTSQAQKTLGPVEGERRAAPEVEHASSGSKRIGLVDPPAPAPPPAPPTIQVQVTPKNADQLLDELERLGKLLEAGAISPEEFAAAKKKLL